MKPPARLHPTEPRETSAVSQGGVDSVGASGAVDVQASESPVDDASRSLSQTRMLDEPRTRPLLPPAYRGRTSGEFVRPVVPSKSSAHSPPARHQEQSNDIAAVLVLAQQRVAALEDNDEQRRLLELGILRRDLSLLRSLLQQRDED